LLGEFFIPGSMLPFSEHQVGLFPDLGTIGPLNLVHEHGPIHHSTTFGNISHSPHSATAMTRDVAAFADREADHVHSLYATRGFRDSQADSHRDSAFPSSRTGAAPAAGMNRGMSGGYGQTGGYMGQRQGVGMQRGGGMGTGMGARSGMGMQQQGRMNGGPQMPMNPNAPIVFLVPTKGVGGFGGLPKMIRLPSLYSTDLQVLTLASMRNHNFRNMGNYFF
jgi:hypothetical protein